jgi:hypothetical protein
MNKSPPTREQVTSNALRARLGGIDRVGPQQHLHMCVASTPLACVRGLNDTCVWEQRALCGLTVCVAVAVFLQLPACLAWQGIGSPCNWNRRIVCASV